MNFFTELFDTSDFPRRWDCGSWTPGLGWLHILSDLGVWSAYLAIPCILVYFVLRKKDMPFRAIFWLFGAFILACGTTHLMEAIIFWWPAYRLAGLIKLFTAIVSWATVIALVPLVPRALAMRSPEELEQEIAERMRAEEALRGSEQLFRQMAESIREMFWMQDGGWKRTLYVSPAYEEVWGRTCQSLYENPRSWIDTVHPDDREEVMVRLEQQLHGMSTDTEFRVARPDGTLRWVRCHAFPIKDHTGEVYRVAGLAEDITERKQAQEALRESEERFRGTFQNAAVGIAHVDAEGRFLLVNEKLCGIVGYTREELLVRTFRDVTHPEDLTVSLEQFHALMRGELPSFSLEKRYLRKDGSVVWGDVSLSIQNGSAGKPAYGIAILQDISERRRLEEELRQAKEEAEAANRSKDEFLANVSHEIRTPMNAILGMTELALDTPLTDDQRQYLKTVKSAADSLLGLINDLLDFSKIEAGKLELDVADFSLRAVLGDTLRALAVRAHKKGLELISYVQSGVPDALVGDAGRLRQSLLNLVGNAIKFTEEGEVVVRVEVASDSVPEGEVGVHFTVTDTGIGIPPEKQETIFRAFEQEDTSTTRKYGGTGLGLTIASRLVALMGGRITVDSQPGRGSTFSFTARFGRQPHQPEPVAYPPVLLRNLRVLLVDDNVTNRRILEEWLRGWQMEPAAVGDGLAALNALWHATSLGRPYPLMLLDARMPDTDGLALAAKLREHNELSSTRIILLTSGDRPGDLARSRQLGINAKLLKPVQQEELLEMIYQVMSRTNGDTTEAARSAPAEEPTRGLGPNLKPLRILIAEDNEFNAQHLERLLVRGDHSVRLANNGREALALLGIDDQTSGADSLTTPGPSYSSSPAKARSATSDFDLLLLDLHMPELDGFQVVQALREREQVTGGHLPVIALTARSRKEDRERCLAAGMDDYLSKPVRSVELFAAIERVLFDHRVPRPILPDTGDSTSLLDPVVLLGACGDDAEGLRAMGQGFQVYLPRRLAEVADALRNEDAPGLRVAAHKLCGLLSAFSTVAGGVASSLEDHAASGSLEECRPLVEQLELMARELVQEMDGLSIESLREQVRAAGDTKSR
ncbi:MAG: PAS domain S-box protein [Planctomycetaceae bacterium]|nr:PAS domain S-box protein [Planctomycetaceae bacterium]